MIVGNTGNYVRTYSDSSYTNQTDTFSASATVYMEVYSSNFTDGTPNATLSSLTLSDFNGNSTSPSKTISKVGTRRYRIQFTLPGTVGDRGVQVNIRNTVNTVLGRPEVLIHVK